MEIETEIIAPRIQVNDRITTFENDIQGLLRDIDTTKKQIEAKLQTLKEDTKRQMSSSNIHIATMEDNLAAFNEEPFRDDETYYAESGSTNEDWTILVDHFE